VVFWLRLDTGAPEALDNGFTALEGQPAPTCEASTRTKLRYARCGDMKSHPEEGFAPDRSMLSRILIGGLAGVLGTGAMTAAMRWLHARLPDEELYPLPPREITEILADGRGGEINLRDASLAARFAFGVAAGALLGAATKRPSLSDGAAFGAAVWGASYFGWVPTPDRP